MTNTVYDPMSLVGRVAFDANGEEIGAVRGVYLDLRDGHPEWAAVGLPDGATTVVPLEGAEIYEDSLAVPFALSRVEACPRRTLRLIRELSEQDKAELYRYYQSGTSSPAAAAAKDQGRQVASTAAEEGQRVADSAKERGQELAAKTKDQARDLAQTATDRASSVAETAKGQAAQVVGEVSEQARSLLEEARSQLESQAEAQTARLAETVRQLGRQTRALAEGRPQEAPTVGGYVSQVAAGLDGLAERLGELRQDIAEQGLSAVVDDLQSFARRRPAAFLLGAMLVGFGAVRVMQPDNQPSAGSGGVRPAARPAIGPRGRS